MYQPSVLDGVTWSTVRRGQPGVLKFTVLKDEILNFQEGNAVKFRVDDVNLFFGFVFKKQRNKNGHIEVTAYDQLRYFKNKDTYVYDNKTADELIRMMANDFNLRVGTLDGTIFKIPTRIEDNKTLFDIVQNALDLTLQNTQKMFVLYDDFGALTLKDISHMKVNALIDDDSAEDFSYTSSIDGETFNRIKLSFENETAGVRDIYISQDSSNINKWGVLQYHETVKDVVNVNAMADAMLRLYNRKTRTLTLSNAFGDIRVRAGCFIPVSLELGDVNVNNFLLVESIQHTFKKDEHWMDLTLRGGGFIA